MAVVLAGSAWLSVVAVGTLALVGYQSTPGRAESAPSEWPPNCGLRSRPDLPQLLMFAHPRCPCTRSSIGELARLMTQCQGKLTATVLFYQPEDAPDDWPHTDLWNSAEMIPGVSVRADVKGVEAQRFGAATSGHVVLYDRFGGLRFRGGITAARGHFGDNVGRSAIVSILRSAGGDAINTPVFGCDLLGSPRGGTLGERPCPQP
ncbi:MAG TPA: RedB protein [Phycisphaerae bacterium]|nr:RedB protein [Phycisphaerae bacterium]